MVDPTPKLAPLCPIRFWWWWQRWLLGLAWTRLSGMYTREKTEVVGMWLSSRWLMTIVYLFPFKKGSKKQCPG